MKVLDSVVIQAVVREVDEQGHVVGETTSSPVKIFPNTPMAENLWKILEADIVKMNQPDSK